MSDALSTSIVVGAISLIPYNRYILWTLASASLVLYSADRQFPWNKHGRLEASIDSVGKTLELATATCGRKYVELMELTSQFPEAKLLTSNIKSRLLETHRMSTWKEFVEYVWNSKEMWKSISRCSNKVEEIRASIERIIEAERQRELSKDIQESRDILSALRRRIPVANAPSAAGSYESIV
ncbi:hypothetical protein B0H12DRAFT_1222149 [Mycena haematopus]|nr:hypothetical protein B0H12DRAFT_1222149 [Mycena haematopus]